MYTSEDRRASVSSIHERARNTQHAPGAHTSYRRSGMPSPDLQRAQQETRALLRRLDFLLSCQPGASPALTHSLLRSMLSEARTVDRALSALTQTHGQEGA